jgi:pimeloyl-ACP methyl ester carboxylesterase
MATIRVNGTQLYYEIEGTSDMPVVLVHGSWGSHHNWDAVAPTLSRSFRLLTYDRRGHSQSARPTSQGSLLEDAMDLAALLEALEMVPAHIVGNSGGAAVTLRLATERPELFRSLTAHEPPLFGLLAGDPAMQAPLASVAQRIGAVKELLLSGDAVAGARQFVETIALGPGGWDRLPEPMRQTFIFNAPTFLDETRDPNGLTLIWICSGGSTHLRSSRMAIRARRSFRVSCRSSRVRSRARVGTRSSVLGTYRTCRNPKRTSMSSVDSSRV